MATATLTSPAAVEPMPATYLLSVDKYQAMVDLGIIGPDDRVELIEGRLIAKMGKNQPHSIGAGRVMERLIRLVPDGYYVGREEPMATDESVPEPDVMIVRGSRDDYPRRPPGPADVLLVVEVADTSLAFDSVTKKRLYARAGVSAYWLLNVPARCLHVFANPTGPVDAPDYQLSAIVREGESVPLVLDGREVARIAVADLLPRAEA